MSKASGGARRGAGLGAGLHGQLSVTGIVIGVIGCVIITASSVYTALTLGQLPWPTIFTSVTALVLLRAFGHTSLSEANVTQVIMSAGSMVAGGLAFTIPGIWILGIDAQVSVPQMLCVALAGTLLGLVCTALIRRRFVDESGLEYPIGTAAAETLTASVSQGGAGKPLFASMGFAGLYAVLRDVLGILPSMLAQLPIPGVSFGISNSPMMLSVGYLVGFGSMAAALLGSVFANFGLVVAAPAFGLWDLDTAGGIVKSLGMGLMMGSGLGVVIKDILPQLAGMVRSRRGNASEDAAGVSGGAAGGRTRREATGLALMVAAVALIICMGLGLGPVVAVAIVLLAFVTTIMSAQSVGQTGIDPLEIFGLIVMLLVAAVCDLPQVKLFFVAGVVAVTCGLAGDVMSDFKTGAILGTDPRVMWKGQAIGSFVGVLVATLTLATLFAAYGPDAFGVDPTGAPRMFVAAQANVVATMVSGIPSVPAFVLGLVAGIALYVAGLPSMMLGLGVYLPFYMIFSMFLGSAIKQVVRLVRRARGLEGDDAGILVASGLLGGESIVGVIIALAGVFGV